MGDAEDLAALEALDAQHRALRREQLKHWTRLQEVDAARCRAVIADPAATREEKHEARIMLGAYAISPGLMAAGGTSGLPAPNEVSARPLERRNHHSRVPPVTLGRLARLARLLNRRPAPTPSPWPDNLAPPPPIVHERRRAPTAASVLPEVKRSEVDAPDLVEEILGWKVLSYGHVALEPEKQEPFVVPRDLASPTVFVQWPHAGWTRAACAGEPKHEPPVEGCTCGIYAVAEARAAFRYLRESPLTVLARVGLAGKVIPGSKGWRGEMARVVALTRTGVGTRDYPHMLARIAEHYRVPILDLDFLDARKEPADGDR